MGFSKNYTRLMKYLYFCSLIFPLHCMSMPNTEQKSGINVLSNQDYPRQSLNSWNDDYKYKHSSNTDGGKVVYIIIVTILGIFFLLIRCCIKYGCSNGEDNYSDAVVHPPPSRSYPRTNHSVLPPPNTRSSRLIRPHDTAFTPPTTRSSTLILPPDTAFSSLYSPSTRSATPILPYDTVFAISSTRSSALIQPPSSNQDYGSMAGIENPGYAPSWNQQLNLGPHAMMDLPPSYDTVIRSGYDADNAFPNVSNISPQKNNSKT